MSSTRLRAGRSGITAVGTTVMPLTQIGVPSTGATTTYTATTIVGGAGSAWDLSAITPNEISKGVWAVTADGFRARVVSATDATDTIVVEHWVTPENVDLPEGSARFPANLGVCTLHRVNQCKRIVVTALEANSATVLIGFNSALPNDGTDGDEISATSANPNAVKVFEAIDGYIDATKLFVNCAGSGQKLTWYAL
jgi:hypothetical protein